VQRAETRSRNLRDSRSVWQRPSAHARIREKAGRLPTPQQRATAEKAVSLAGGEDHVRGQR
jgi:hypothetical protein